MSVEELRATFAAREPTLDYLVKALRAQTRARTPSSFLITGPRGAGKTTMVRMLCLRIDEDAELRAAWLPVRFTEELPRVVSLRDLFALTLERLAEQGVADAQAAGEAVQAEPNDEQSQELAVGALRRISQEQGRRLILFIENLDSLFAAAIDEHSAATLRRLLMVDPFMMIVGTAVRQFDALQRYDQSLFNYFGPVPLGRLDDQQVKDMLFRRAAFDAAEGFAEQYQRHKPKIQALTRMTGGNPRLVMMLYEVLSHGDFGSAVTMLRKLVDDLTPLLKDLLEHQLSAQQRKLLDAIMRAGGTAKPSDISRATRVALNSVTRQLQRLKEMQLVEVLGGGKGQDAYYTVPDQMFCTWYQMRYVQPQRRRIELFVDILRIWFEADERLTKIRELATKAAEVTGKAALDTGMAIEYFGASLAGTQHESEARELVVSSLLRLGQIDQAALSLAESIEPEHCDLVRNTQVGYAALVTWCIERHDFGLASRVLDMIQDPILEQQAAEVALLAAFGHTSIEEIEPLAVEILRRVAEMSLPNALGYLLVGLIVLARPLLRAKWVRLFRSLLARASSEVRTGLEYLSPAADVLEIGDPTCLDPLPPEQREAMRAFLSRFEPTEGGDPPPVSQ
jgi:DNA-binding transcriptional ArsR family regulator